MQLYRIVHVFGSVASMNFNDCPKLDTSKRIRQLCTVVMILVGIGMAALWPCAVNAAAPFAAIWADDGQMPIFQEERPFREHGNLATISYVWDGNQITIKGAKNEVIEFNLVLEGHDSVDISGVTVNFDSLTGPNGYQMKTRPVSGDAIFNYVGRQIELFFIEYPQWNGTGEGTGARYIDAYHFADPEYTPSAPYEFTFGDLALPKFRLDYENRIRPNFHKHVPDIAIPIELINPDDGHKFTVEHGKHQAIWADIYIPKDAPAGIYTGNVIVKINDVTNQIIPVRLMVRNFTLPDENQETWSIIDLGYLTVRFYGRDEYYAHEEQYLPEVLASYENIMKLSQRHRITNSVSNLPTNPSIWQCWSENEVTYENTQYSATEKTPCWAPDDPAANSAWLDELEEWVEPVVTGTLFTPGNGYEGPGEGRGMDLIGLYTYFAVPIKGADEAQGNGFDGDKTYPRTKQYLIDWAPYWNEWIATHAPHAEYFYYMMDEVADMLPWNNALAQAVDQLPQMPGQRKMKVFSSITMIENGNEYNQLYPDIDMWYLCSGACSGNWSDQYQALIQAGHSGLVTNGSFPAFSSFEIEQSYRRAASWAVEKLEPGMRQFSFMTNLWANDVFGWGGDENIFLNFWEDTHTHGMKADPPWTDIPAIYTVVGNGQGYDSHAPEDQAVRGYEYRNTAGLLVYPGKDGYFPQHSYGIKGGFASLRLKKWRRGVQDALYIRMARKVNPTQTDQIIQQIAPEVLWEYQNHPGVHSDWMEFTDHAPGFSLNGDDYAQALEQLSQIIEGAGHIVDIERPQITPRIFVPKQTANPEPSYTFYSTEAGTITYSGDCSSSQTYAQKGLNTITFDPLPEGTYSNCVIVVTDAAGNTSPQLLVREFTIDFDAGEDSYRSDVDGNGYTNVVDAILVLRKAGGLDMNGTAWHDSAVTGDANCDGNVNETDGLLILRYSAGLEMEGTGWCVTGNGQ